jgi:hypothetical protein
MCSEPPEASGDQSSDAWALAARFVKRGVIDMDISKYGDRRSDDTIPHEKLREILGQRVSDGVIHGKRSFRG